MKKYLIVALITLFSLSALAKVEVTNEKKPPTDPEKVKIVSYDKGEFKDCEEIGMIHSQSFWGAYSTKKGMIKRMKKQAAEVGATHILLSSSGHNDYTGANTGNGTVFYCPTEAPQK